MPRHANDRTKVRNAEGPRHRAWTSMRVMVRFSRVDIETTAEIKTDNLLDYLRQLTLCGYLHLVVKRQAGGGGVWQLIRNTGPKAPIASIDGTCFDQNEQKVYAPPETEPKPEASSNG